MAIYIKFDGIDGEVTDVGFENNIEVLSFSWGMTNEGSRFGGGGGSGRVNVQDFNFTKHTDKSSPVLMLKCATGQHIKKAVLFVRKQGSEDGLQTAAIEGQSAVGGTTQPEVGLQLNLYDVMVSGFVIKGEQKVDNDWPSESLSLNFTRVEFIERYQKIDSGGLSEPITGTWDIKTNKIG